MRCVNIQAKQPDILVIELCKARTNLLQLDEAQSLNLDKIMEIIRSEIAIRHMSGIVNKWGTVTQDQVMAVVKVDPPSLLARAAVFTVKSLCLCVGWLPVRSL